MTLWTKEEALRATGGTHRGLDRDWSASGVSIDTRTLKPGDLFVALDGDNSDGHLYLDKAFEAGAAAALVHRVPAEFDHLGPLLEVGDTLKGLEALGIAARARTHAKIVAVTGSVGKTGTKEMLASVFAGQGKTHASVASYNNHWGVPLTLARMPADTEFGVFEIGMNHAGEITPLTKMVRPHAAIVTTVAAVHLENFASVEKIADAKAEIFAGVEPGGVAIINRDNEYFARLAASATRTGIKVVEFGSHPSTDVHLVKQVLLSDCSSVSATVGGQAMAYKIGMPGAHLVMNSLSVLAAVYALGADLALAGFALGELEAPKGRGRRHHIELPMGTITLIDESYNANPTSMRSALANLGQTVPLGRGRRIAVLGDMLELGPDEKALHAGLSDAIDESGVDLAFLAGPLMAALADALPVRIRGGHWKRAADLQGPLIEALRDGDVVMVKGSFGSRMGPLVDALTERGQSDDRARVVAGGA